jgi:hypothetical protein
MQPYLYYLASATLLGGVLCLAAPGFSQTQNIEPRHDHATHQHTDICAGFVVLPNGYVVLSAMAPGSTSGMQHSLHHGAGHGQTSQPHGMADKQSRDHKPQVQPSRGMQPTDHLMGYKHGDAIPTGKGMLCVPIGTMASTSWTSVSAAPAVQVTAKSVKGVLAHNSRANESLSFHIMKDGQPVEQANVHVIARMPHHDHRMPSGHGPANDPDVQGLEARPQGKGNYTLPTVDFSMGGPWFFEVRIQDGDTVHKAYFASEIGEE